MYRLLCELNRCMLLKATTGPCTRDILHPDEHCSTADGY